MSELYLMRAEIDMVNLSRFAAERRHSDPDRTAHCLVLESFGKEHAPRPFIVKTRQANQNLEGHLLAYAQTDAQTLIKKADQHQKLAHSAVMNPNTIKTVNIPNNWEVGQPIRFQIRVRPTKRASSRDIHRGGSESDIYLKVADTHTRAEAYCEWLSDILKHRAGLDSRPENMQLSNFALRRIKRQNSSNWITGPDATITGLATITDPQAFHSALKNGIGRHKSFGYGMLLITPA